MEELLKQELNTTRLELISWATGGMICTGCTYMTDTEKVFVKFSKLPLANIMFEGEFDSLQTLAGTNILHVPQPRTILKNPDGGWMFVMEHFDMQRLGDDSAYQLGEEVARLHMLNEEVRKCIGDSSSVHQQEQSKLRYTEKFGFHRTTCCGFIPQDNTWQTDWLKFLAQKMDIQMKLIIKDYQDREAQELWSELLIKLPEFFKHTEIKPALLHGDLWMGNIGQTSDGPVVYDPSCFYGHAEFEMAYANMPGKPENAMPQTFFDGYHKHIPKQAGADERYDLYNIFNYMNHWNHFGTRFRERTISTIRKAATAPSQTRESQLEDDIHTHPYHEYITDTPPPYHEYITDMSFSQYSKSECMICLDAMLDKGNYAT